MIWKTVTAQFLNTTMVTFVIKYFAYESDKKAIWGGSGLLPYVLALFMNQCIVTPLFRIVDYWWLINWCKRRSARNSIKEGTCALT
jgi:hypothetical protein